MEEHGDQGKSGKRGHLYPLLGSVFVCNLDVYTNLLFCTEDYGAESGGGESIRFIEGSARRQRVQIIPMCE